MGIMKVAYQSLSLLLNMRVKERDRVHRVIDRERERERECVCVCVLNA